MNLILTTITRGILASNYNMTSVRYGRRGGHVWRQMSICEWAVPKIESWLSIEKPPDWVCLGPPTDTQQLSPFTVIGYNCESSSYVSNAQSSIITKSMMKKIGHILVFSPLALPRCKLFFMSVLFIFSPHYFSNRPSSQQCSGAQREARSCNRLI